MTSGQHIANDLPHWDLSNVFPDVESEAYSRAVEELGARLDDLDAFMAGNTIDPHAGFSGDATSLARIIGAYLDRMNAIMRQYRTLQAFARAFVSTDSYNTAARRRYSELEFLGVRLYQQSVRFQSWIGRSSGLLPDALEREGQAQRHAFFLLETAQQSKYLMSEAEESLAAELSLSGPNAWQKLQHTVCSQLTVPFELGGAVSIMPITALQNLRYSPDGSVRKRAYEAELKAWETVREPLAAALNGVKGGVITVEGRRGRPDRLHATLDQSRIDRRTLETMLLAMQDAFPVFRRYLQAKATRLGKEALPWWDLFAPVARADRRFTFREAQNFVVQQFRSFSDRLADFSCRAFDNHWIDAEPREGKGGGAFCTSLPGVEESRVLCNFDGSLDQVFTLAHELGHAYHNECRIGKTMLQRSTPMTLAETASIFCETIVTDAMLAEATSREEELSILETFLVGATQVIVDISSRFLFEKEVFARREKSELSADDFCEIMLDSQRATYGNGLDQRYLNPYMWAWKSHYYRPTLSFYNFPYAFGLLFGLGLYAVYQQQGSAFLQHYDALLASTGEGSAAELAGRFGMDIREPAFWERSLALIEARVDRYCEL